MLVFFVSNSAQIALCWLVPVCIFAWKLPFVGALAFLTAFGIAACDQCDGNMYGQRSDRMQNMGEV
jgi:hypothetical protein